MVASMLLYKKSESRKKKVMSYMVWLYVMVGEPYKFHVQHGLIYAFLRCTAARVSVCVCNWSKCTIVERRAHCTVQWLTVNLTLYSLFCSLNFEAIMRSKAEWRYILSTEGIKLLLWMTLLHGMWKFLYLIIFSFIIGFFRIGTFFFHRIWKVIEKKIT